MSIQSEITRINSNVQSTLQTIADTGVTVGTNSDALQAAATALANEKQNKLTGTAGQVVGFDADGNAVATALDVYSKAEVDAAIQAAIQSTWEASY